MAKATLTTKDGLKITVEGTPEEVASLVQKLEGGGDGDGRPRKKAAATPRTKRATTAKSGPADLIAELIEAASSRRPRNWEPFDWRYRSRATTTPSRRCRPSC